jgi:excisionase family DNA binding protein
MSENKITEQMLTVNEVGRLLHVYENTIRRWADQGKIKSYRITQRGDRRFKNEDITHFLTRFNGNIEIKQ